MTIVQTIMKLSFIINLILMCFIIKAQDSTLLNAKFQNPKLFEIGTDLYGLGRYPFEIYGKNKQRLSIYLNVPLNEKHFIEAQIGHEHNYLSQLDGTIHNIKNSGFFFQPSFGINTGPEKVFNFTFGLSVVKYKRDLLLSIGDGNYFAPYEEIISQTSTYTRFMFGWGLRIPFNDKIYLRINKKIGLGWDESNHDVVPIYFIPGSSNGPNLINFPINGPLYLNLVFTI